MSDRVVKVRLLAQVSEYEAGMLKAARATRTVGTEAEKLEQKRKAFDSFGRGLVVTGAALAGVTALSIKAAMGWESAWAGVTKTVEGTPAELAKVEDGLRSLTGVLPASHDEIAAVAEAAGQLGIKTPNVVAFTRTMIDLGETTNLSANEAATALARFVNIMGTSQSQVSNLGSAIVGLGNNYATTEAEIMEMSLRLAGAGKQIGLSEGDVLGLATALSSVGIEAEAGGSAMSKVMIDIASQVENGGDKLEKFATTAGMTSEQFSKLWRKDSAAALSAFVTGLANAESQGQSTLGILEDLGITEVRMRDALLRSSAAAEIFSASMAMGNDEFEKNNALTNEAAKRYETVESKLRIAGNSVRDAAIDFGEVFLPAVANAAEGVGDFASFMGDLPDPVQGFIGVMTGATGALALAGGTALLAVPKFAEFKAGMELLTGSTFTTKGALSSMWRFLTGPWGIAMIAAATAVVGLQVAQDKLRTSTEEFQNVIQNAKSVDDLFEVTMSSKGVFGRLDEAIQSVDAFKQKLDIVANNDFLRGMDGAAGNLKSALGELGQQLATTAGSDLPAAQRAFQMLADEYKLNRDEQQWLLDAMPEYKKALQDQANQLGVNVTTLTDAENAQALLNLALGNTPDPAADAEEALAAIEEEAKAADDALQGTVQALDDVAGAAMSMGDAKDRALAALNGLKTAAEEEGAALDGTNDASIRLRDSLRDVETAHRDSAEAIIHNGGTLAEAQAEWQKGRDAVIDMLVAKGLDRAEAVRWADQQLGSASAVKGGIDEVYRAWLNLPENKHTKYEVEKAEAERRLQELKATLSSIPTYKRITLESFTVGKFDVTPNAAGGYYSGGVKAFAGGGYEPGIYGHQRGGIHKFAEEYDEAYISMDPARRAQSERVFVQAGLRMGFLDPNGGGGSDMPSAEHIGAAVAKALGRGLRGVANRPVIVAINGQAIASAVNNENQWG
ncbi:phage tail tape measure protein [Microbacterium paludicola]|uniref:phage tail tape measure protein n=1 Tax=Microbacterium paludicola TaxID=300019 RepID=UPI0011A14565|nr:phage tail tape measure protein [Microbacterium paludicola]